MKIRETSILMARATLFIIYFWFGLLKVIGASPASTLIEHLLSATMPFIPFSVFIIVFGLFEMTIGILFLVPDAERWVTVLFTMHMLTAFLPLFVMREVWTHPFAPTLEGQYIIKNLALITCVLAMWSGMSKKQKVVIPSN